MQYLRSLSRRRLLTGLAGAAATALTAACGGAPAASPTAAPKVAEATKPAAATTAPAAGAATAAPTAAAKAAEATKPAAAAATTPAAGATTAPAAQPAAKLGKTKIVFWGHDNHPVANAVPGFKERQPDVQVETQALGDWLVKLRATLASGKDVPDLV